MVTVPKVKNGVKISYLSLKHDNLNVLLRIIHGGCSHIVGETTKGLNST